MRTFVVFLIVLAGAAVASFDPVRSPRRGLRWLVAIIVLCFAAGWIVDASRDGLPALAARVNWREGVQCASEVMALSVPAMLGLGLLMRRGAALAWVAFVFVFACPHDDPLYIALWYAVRCGAVIAFARLALPRLTRW